MTSGLIGVNRGRGGVCGCPPPRFGGDVQWSGGAAARKALTLQTDQTREFSPARLIRVIASSSSPTLRVAPWRIRGPAPSAAAEGKAEARLGETGCSDPSWRACLSASFCLPGPVQLRRAPVRLRFPSVRLRKRPAADRSLFAFLATESLPVERPPIPVVNLGPRLSASLTVERPRI